MKALILFLPSQCTLPAHKAKIVSANVISVSYLFSPQWSKCWQLTVPTGTFAEYRALMWSRRRLHGGGRCSARHQILLFEVESWRWNCTAAAVGSGSLIAAPESKLDAFHVVLFKSQQNMPTKKETSLQQWKKVFGQPWHFTQSQLLSLHICQRICVFACSKRFGCVRGTQTNWN